jgi:hypothetical protein
MKAQKSDIRLRIRSSLLGERGYGILVVVWDKNRGFPRSAVNRRQSTFQPSKSVSKTDAPAGEEESIGF